MSRQYPISNTFPTARHAARELEAWLWTRPETVDVFFYYFTQTHQLTILPMPATRAWFIPRQDQFPERETTTPVGNEYYTTVGRLVPVEIASREVTGVWNITIP